MIQCNEMHLSVAEYRHPKRAGTHIRGPNGERVPLHDLWMTLSFSLPDGQDKYLELSVSLRQNGQELARHRQVIEGDEGEINVLRPIRFRYDRTKLDLNEEPPEILFQMQELPERGTPTKNHPSGWFSVWLTHEVLRHVN